MNNAIKADAAFLRRIFLGLVFVTVVAGALAAFTTVQAMNTQGQSECLFFCE